MTASVHEWNDPPPMEVGAPLPSIRTDDTHLWVAYLCRNPDFPGWDTGASPDHPGFHIWSAIIQFDGVSFYHFGAPNDERLSTHPLYAVGLGFYGFFEARNTHQLATHKNKKHWIITFHDETLEVVADSASVIQRRIDGEDTHAALEKIG